MSLATIDEAIQAFQQGRMVIIVDDEDRENEGDLVVAADFATPEAINFMARHGCGLICAPITGDRIEQLGLSMMVPPDENGAQFNTPFTVSVEAREGVTTGISAHDRARTIEVLTQPQYGAADIVTPGHIFPLRARDEGVLVRRGQTEASVDLAKLAGLTPAAVICEILHEDGTMKRLPQLIEYAKQHDLLIISVEQLVEYRQQMTQIDTDIEYIATAELPTDYGNFEMRVYHDKLIGKDHMAIISGELSELGDAPLVRLHSECLTGDALGSARCDCGPQLRRAQEMIAAESGIILYLRQEGRGIGLANKIRAYELQDQGYDTVEANEHLGFHADERDYGTAAQMLHDLGITRVRLMTNNPAKIAGLEEHGIEVVERLSHFVGHKNENHNYLRTKQEKMDHMLPYLNGHAPVRELMG